MMGLSINMLKYDPYSDEPLKVQEYDFWKYYLELLNVKAGTFMGEPEIKVLAYVLAGVPNRSYFKRPYSKEMEDFLEIKLNYLHQIKNILLEKGLIVKTEIRGDYILHKNLISFQTKCKKSIAEGKEIEFKFKLEVK